MCGALRARPTHRRAWGSLSAPTKDWAPSEREKNELNFFIQEQGWQIRTHTLFCDCNWGTNIPYFIHRAALGRERYFETDTVLHYQAQAYEG